jgi:hypothetical protein
VNLGRGDHEVCYPYFFDGFEPLVKRDGSQNLSSMDSDNIILTKLMTSSTLLH